MLGRGLEGARRATGSPLPSMGAIMKEEDMEHKHEKAGRKRRKRLTAEKKFEIFLETSKADTVIGEVLRREGIYASDLSRYRELVREGAIERLKSSVKRGQTDDERCIARLKEELRKQNEVIAQLSRERMILSKKVNGE